MKLQLNALEATGSQKKAAPQTSEKGQYPESTEGSKIAKEARKLGNMMSEKEVESKFALAMSLMDREG